MPNAGAAREPYRGRGRCQENRPPRRHGAPQRDLQLRQAAQDDPRHSGDGSGNSRSCLEFGGIGGITREQHENEGDSVKRFPTILAAVTGLIVGFLCATYVGMAVGLATCLTPTATVSVVILCPVIYSIRWNFFVPILNAILYGSVAFGVAKWRHAARRKPN